MKIARSYILEQGQHFVVGAIVGNEVGDIAVVENGGNADETSSASGNNADVFVAVLAFFALSVVDVVQVCHCSSETLDTRLDIFSIA